MLGGILVQLIVFNSASGLKPMPDDKFPTVLKKPDCEALILKELTRYVESAVTTKCL